MKTNDDARMRVPGQGDGSSLEHTADKGELHVVVRRARRIRTAVKAGKSGHTNMDVDCELGSGI